MPLAEARVLIPSGWFFVDSPAADDEQLRQLAWDCQQFTSRAGLEEAIPPECLFLDVTGCVHPFGSIERLGESVVESFQLRGYRVRIAVAPTFGAAWAVAHATREANLVVLNEEEVAATLDSLSVGGLRLPEDTLLLLEEFGIKTIGQLMKLPRSSLPSRFGPELRMRLDQAQGNTEEILKTELSPQPIGSESRFEFPLEDIRELSAALQPLLRNAIAELKQRHQQTQCLRVNWKTENGQNGELEIRLLRSTADAAWFEELLSLHWEKQRFTSGIISLHLEIIPCRAEAERRTLFDRDDEDSESEFLHLVERLSSRLGSQAVGYSQLLPDAQPERAAAMTPWLLQKKMAPDQQLVKTTVRPIPDPSVPFPLHQVSHPSLHQPLHRPFQLLAKPVSIVTILDELSGLPSQFHWRGQDHTVARCEGPEQIETGWWRAVMIRRSYYRIETDTGTRFWLFKDRAGGNWFMHGIFD